MIRAQAPPCSWEPGTPRSSPTSCHSRSRSTIGAVIGRTRDEWDRGSPPRSHNMRREIPPAATQEWSIDMSCFGQYINHLSATAVVIAGGLAMIEPAAAVDVSTYLVNATAPS